MSSSPSVTFDASRTGWFAFKDLLDGLKLTQVWLTFAIMDVKLRYRRTYLGPFWITLSTAIMVAAFGYVFGSIFKVEDENFVPFIAVGMVIWGYISATILDACSIFSGSSSYIKNLSLPLSTYLYRTIARNIFMMAHNCIVIVVVFFVYPPKMEWQFLLFIPGFILLTLNLTWGSLVLGIVASRYRDVPAAVMSIMTVAYLVTPIIWHPDLVSDRPHIVDFNPFYHLVEVVRAPLLGDVPTTANYLFSLVILAVGFGFTMALYKAKCHRLSYWL
jgi:ABC-type polysaccharide/polyol phosphate export permease